jgi:hypothetical protein
MGWIYLLMILGSGGALSVTRPKEERKSFLLGWVMCFSLTLYLAGLLALASRGQ